ncbi:MAG: tetratricopeptide repeat protein [Phycisphaeraceae bacterium]
MSRIEQAMDRWMAIGRLLSLSLLLPLVAPNAWADVDAIEPPAFLVASGVVLELDAAAKTKAEMDDAAVVASLGAVDPIERAADRAPAVLDAEAAALLNDSEKALAVGEVFRAVRLLGRAEAIAPDHPAVVRALGIAYAMSGNEVRAATYLRRAFANDPADAEVAMRLAHYAAASSSLAEAFAFAEAFESAGGPALIADRFRAEALGRAGYLSAAAERLSLVSSGIDAFDLDRLEVDDRSRPAVAQASSVIAALRPQLAMERGDLLLSLGRYAEADRAYAAASTGYPSPRYPLSTRRVYLSLRSGAQAAAIGHAISYLSSADASPKHAALVTYLVEQGVLADQLAAALSDAIDRRGGSLALLTGLSRVAEKSRVVERVRTWLSEAPIDTERLGQAIALMRFDDDDPADAQPLLSLMRIVSGLMRERPERATAYARAFAERIDAPVTVLRALKRDPFAGEADGWLVLLAAELYATVGRTSDAIEQYRRAFEVKPDLGDDAELALAALLMERGDAADALDALGGPTLDDDWPRFDLGVRALAAAGETTRAIQLADERVEAFGKDRETDLLRIKLIAMLGEPQQACNLLIRVISNHPSDPLLYELGFDLVYDYQSGFSSIHDAERMRRAFTTKLTDNLPNSSMGRFFRVVNMLSNPSRHDEAIALLRLAIDEDPTNTEAMALLVQLYDMTGDTDAADAAHQRHAEAMGIGVARSLLIASRGVSIGEPERAARALRDMLALDREGVLPGPAMTGDQANAVLTFLDAADPAGDIDTLAIELIRRFPDHPGLNNGIGYRWAVQGKNLLQAEAMIQRALDIEGMDHSLLDSMAWVQYKLGDFDAALATQSHALRLLEATMRRFGNANNRHAATRAILSDHMGDILYRKGDAKRALEHWREALKQNFDDDETLLDPELMSLGGRLKAKIEAMAKGQDVPTAEVPGPAARGPKGHPADLEPAE